MRGRHPAPGSCRTVLTAVAAQEIPPAVNVSHVTKKPSVNPQAGGEQGGGHRMLWGPLRWVSPSLWGYWALPTESLTLPQAAALCPHTAGGAPRGTGVPLDGLQPPFPRRWGWAAGKGTSVCFSLRVKDCSCLGVMAGPGRPVCGRDGGHGGWAITGGLDGVCSTGCRVGP